MTYITKVKTLILPISFYNKNNEINLDKPIYNVCPTSGANNMTNAKRANYFLDAYGLEYE